MAGEVVKLDSNHPVGTACLKTRAKCGYPQKLDNLHKCNRLLN
jgi:hypothetical protein